MVSDLMEERGSEWKIDVIKEVFNERDAKNILMDEMGEDKLCLKV